MYLTVCFHMNYPFAKVLVYVDIPETELVWVKSEPGHVPDGAVVAGQRSNGDLLYVAMTHGEAGHYDINKRCVEYFTNNGNMCKTPNWILAVEHSESLNRIFRYTNLYLCQLNPIIDSGSLFTKMTPSYGCRNPHYKPQTVWRPSQLFNGNPYTNNTVFYWIEDLVIVCCLFGTMVL